MAGASLLTLLDDIATLMDDVAAMTKLATKKTAGVLGDDLALNAEQVQGVVSDRELPVVWAVAKGSLVNKAILVPLALLLSVVAQWAIIPLLMVGGAFLCYEGFEKVWEKLFHRTAPPGEALSVPAALSPQEFADLEKTRIRGAIRTDFILSAEIVVISLGAIMAANVSVVTRVVSLVSVALVVSVGVYAFVALIVRLDDIGFSLRKRGGVSEWIGRALLSFAPLLMRSLGVIGTVAMFLVGGGIIAHNIPPLYQLTEGWIAAVGSMTGLLGTLRDFLVGMTCGGVIVAGHHLYTALFGKKAAH